MNTTYPNKGRQRITAGPHAPSSHIRPNQTYKLEDIGNGFWGFNPGKNVQLTRDAATGFLVVGNVGVNASVEVLDAGGEYLLSYI